MAMMAPPRYPMYRRRRRSWAPTTTGGKVMEKTAKNKWLVRGAAVLVFVLGFAAGALALNFYRHWAHVRAVAPDDYHARFEQTLESLKLNDDQKNQARQILADTRVKLQALRQESAPKVADIRKDADERLQ